MAPAKTIVQMPIHNPHNVEAEIVFDDDENVGTGQEIHQYTTYDDISGHVSFRSRQSVPTEFDHVQIALTGFTKTFKHDHLTPQPSATQAYASHVFLRLTMPIPPSAYNGDFTLKKSQPRSFPFHFVVPAQLLNTACKHPIGGEHVQEAHSNLPPSMGEYLLPLDDLAPEMAKISYAVTAKLVSKAKDNGKTINLAAAQRKMHIIPAIPELPPTHIPKTSEKWVLSKTKSMKRGVFKGKLGTVTVSTSQPRALVLNPSSRHQPTAIATVNYKFYPAEAGTKPPRLGAIGSKLRGTTYSSIRAVAEIPDDHAKATPLERFSGIYNNTISLAHRCVENVQWEWHVPAPAYVRRDSGYSSSSINSGSVDSFDPPQDSSKGWYEASVPIPITLPKSKTWLPTFHSCLVSRFYTLVLETSIHTPGTAVPQTQITLRCPIQIASIPREGRHQSFVENAPRGEMVPSFSDAVHTERERGERSVAIRSEARRLQEIEEEVDAQLRRDLGRATRESLQVQELPPGYERRIGVGA